MSDDSRKIFVGIFFKPFFSFFGVISASLIIHLEEPDRIDRPKYFHECFDTLFVDNIFVSLLPCSFTSMIHSTGFLTFSNYLVSVPLKC